MLQIISEVEVQSLQLSMEQTATSSSTYAANTSANSLDDGHQLTVSSPSSTSTSTTVMPVRAAKTRAARKTRPRTSPYPATSPPVAAVAVESLQQHADIIQPSDHDQQQQQYTSPMMDTYRYDHGIHQAQQQSGQYAMYSGYSNGNDVAVHQQQQQLYNYGGPNGHEAGSSNHSAADLYNPYYTETDANGATASIYPSALVLPRHYTAMPEGILTVDIEMI